ncbi:serine/arginine repetitive matrix protein 1 [Streptomyces sp. TverLS-915]|nr:serine/arginine repetitive matrix protein 1 [Streptomyces sp. TverLS-915]
MSVGGVSLGVGDEYWMSTGGRWSRWWTSRCWALSRRTTRRGRSCGSGGRVSGRCSRGSWSRAARSSRCRVSSRTCGTARRCPATRRGPCGPSWRRCGACSNRGAGRGRRRRCWSQRDRGTRCGPQWRTWTRGASSGRRGRRRARPRSWRRWRGRSRCGADPPTRTWRRRRGRARRRRGWRACGCTSWSAPPPRCSPGAARREPYRTWRSSSRRTRRARRAGACSPSRCTARAVRRRRCPPYDGRGGRSPSLWGWSRGRGCPAWRRTSCARRRTWTRPRRAADRCGHGRRRRTRGRSRRRTAAACGRRRGSCGMSP